MSRLGEAARDMMGILERHEPKAPAYAITPAERASLRASGAIRDPLPQPYALETLKDRARAERRAKVAAAVADYMAIEWPAPYGTLRRIAVRHGVDYATLANAAHKARKEGNGVAA